MHAAGIPRDDDGPWDWLLFEQSGVVTYAQALEHFSASHIRHQIGRGLWRRIARGVILAGRELGSKQQLRVAVLTAGGRTRFLDAYWRKAKLHVEVDGAHHVEARHWSADMLRQNEVWLEGDRVLRFPAFLLRANPGQVVEQISRALRI